MTSTDCSFLRLRKTHPIRLAAAVAAIMIAFTSLLPESSAFESGFGDKFEHLTAYLVLSLLVTLGWAGRIAPGMIVGAAIGFGGILELLQAFSPGRQPDWADFAVNSIGALTGLAIAMMVRKAVNAFASSV